MENNALVHVLRPDQARVNITYAGQNGDLPDPVSFDTNDADIKGMITEAIRAGSIPGIPADPHAALQDFVIDRYAPNEQRPYNLLQLRPKTPFGMVGPGGYRPSNAPTGITQATPTVTCCPHCRRAY